MNTTQSLINNNAFSGLKQWIYSSLYLFEGLPKQRQLLYRGIISLLFGLFNGSIAGFEQFYFASYGCDKLRYIICRAKLPWFRICYSYTRWAIKLAIRLSEELSIPISVSIDDMIEDKDSRSKNIVKGGKKNKRIGFSFVTGVIIVGYVHIPLIPKLAFRKKVCDKLGRPYLSKIKLAMEMIEELHLNGLNDRKVEILLDSWYPSEKMLKTIKSCGFEVTAGIKKNRHLNGVPIKNYNNDPDLKWRRKKINDYFYYIAVKTGTLNGGCGRYKILLSRRVRIKDNKESWRYILTSKLYLNRFQIAKCYERRWAVETFHQIWQYCFGINKWRVWGIIRQRNMVIISVMSMGFAVHYSLKHLNEEEKNALLVNKQSIIGVGLKIIRATLNSKKVVFKIAS